MSEPKGRLRGVWSCVEGLRIFARTSRSPISDGPPVILVHGYGMSSSYMVPIAKRLAAEHTVYAPDLPGHGRSDNPPKPLSIHGLAESLRIWMDRLGIDRAAFLGNSMGCQVIAELAVRHPERIDRLILVGPTVDPAARTLGRELPRLLKDGAAERPSLLLLVGRAYGREGFRRLFEEMDLVLADRIEEKLPRIKAPSLVVRGERDAVAPQPWAEEVARELGAGAVRVIPGKGHAPNYSAPDELMRVIRPFLSSPGEGVSLEKLHDPV
ncbi:MAG TPA: alpha/beta hydrolase [Thermoanaerobaculia bacterium]|nr:alpha/beta hydrolase [Thermoanaerobaculia bacterium]